MIFFVVGRGFGFAMVVWTVLVFGLGVIGLGFVCGTEQAVVSSARVMMAGRGAAVLVIAVLILSMFNKGVFHFFDGFVGGVRMDEFVW